MSNQEIVVQTTNDGFMNVTTLEHAQKCASLIASSSFCPKGLQDRPGDVLVALQMGQELGLKPMQAIQNIAVINGRPSLWGDAMLAVCRLAKGFEFIKEEYDEVSKRATCVVKRRNEPEVTSSFSMEDAKLAGLWGKQGPWSTYPRRMLQMRARGFALRDAFPDTLRGIIIKEEAEDYPTQRTDYSKVGGTVFDNRVESPLVNQSEIGILNQKIAEAGAQKENICARLKLDHIEDMNLNQWNEVCKRLEKQAIKKRQADHLEINKFFDDEEEPKQ